MAGEFLFRTFYNLPLKSRSTPGILLCVLCAFAGNTTINNHKNIHYVRATTYQTQHL